MLLAIGAIVAFAHLTRQHGRVCLVPCSALMSGDRSDQGADRVYRLIYRLPSSKAIKQFIDRDIDSSARSLLGCSVFDLRPGDPSKSAYRAKLYQCFIRWHSLTPLAKKKADRARRPIGR
jgi:hypothetical protein